MRAMIIPTICVVAFFIAGCEQPPIDRAGRLLTMAGEESAGIPKTIDRFSRQLNIAYAEVNTGRNPEALKTLHLARETLTGAQPGDFDGFHLIAAWASIAQLSLRAGDRQTALQSADLALAALNDLKPPAERTQYVRSLAYELAELRGKTATVELLNNAGTWAAEVVDLKLRREAFTSFAFDLAQFDAFEDARAMLHRDPDVAWRTDEFLAIANASGSGGSAGGGATGPSISAFVTFGKEVRFEKVYYQAVAK